MLATRAQHLKVPRAVAVCLVVAALMVRALVPAGLMPDLSAMRAGQFKLTLCTPYGLKVVVTTERAGTPSDPAEHAPAKTADGTCAFAGLISAADVPACTGASPARAWAVAVKLGPIAKDTRAPAIQFAALGPRAPPAQLT